MNDLINGLLELFGALLLLGNCRILLRHRRVQGVSVTPTAFFSAWGVWNLYFYPTQGLWLSFFGGVCLACVNLAWVGLAFYYCHWPKGPDKMIAMQISYFNVPRPASPRADFIAGAELDSDSLRYPAVPKLKLGLTVRCHAPSTP